jgi:glyoxylase-like metal-dependent hydrolase (beta-lactamase superfamily II)
MEDVKQINAGTLQNWLEAGNTLSVVDIRPMAERAEWHIPGSIHVDVYDRLKHGDYTVFEGVQLDKTIPVVTVCAGGKMSLNAAHILQKHGFETYSLEGGMKAWSLAWNKAVILFKDFEVIQLRRTGKGCLSYIIASQNHAIVVDASLPVDVYEQQIKSHKLKLVSVMETHVHADHLSRSKQLAERNAVPLLLPLHSNVQFQHQKLQLNQRISLGKIIIDVITTPGHTLDSTCFLINDEVLLSGDTLFTNAVGRPDLKASVEEAKQKAEMLYDSLQSLLLLNDDVVVLPAHTTTPAGFDGKPIKATIRDVKETVSLLELSKAAFAETILSKLPPNPPNHILIVEKNQSGDLSGINPIDLEAGANRCAVS